MYVFKKNIININNNIRHSSTIIVSIIFFDNNHMFMYLKQAILSTEWMMFIWCLNSFKFFTQNDAHCKFFLICFNRGPNFKILISSTIRQLDFVKCIRIIFSKGAKLRFKQFFKSYSVMFEVSSIIIQSCVYLMPSVWWRL